MAFDGSGIFLRLRNWVADATAGVKIRADFHDLEDDNFASGLSQCIVKDGQTTITQNIPFNSKRVTALQDPVDPQDAATKAYADTKASLAGGASFTGDVVLKETTPSLTLDGVAGQPNSIIGQKADKNRWQIVLGNGSPETGSNAGSDFNLLNYADAGTLLGSVLDGVRSTGMLSVKANPTAALGIATKQYVDIADATKLPLTGGTITGNLTINGSLAAGSWLMAQNGVVYLNASANRYLQWTSDQYNLGGATTLTVGGYTVWHSGNFNPAALGTVSDVRLAMAADYYVSGEMGGDVNEPFLGAVMTGFAGHLLAYLARFRWLQVNKGSGFVTVGTA